MNHNARTVGLHLHCPSLGHCGLGSMPQAGLPPPPLATAVPAEGHAIVPTSGLATGAALVAAATTTGADSGPADGSSLVDVSIRFPVAEPKLELI